MLIVIHADMRALGYCNRGARSWFARHQLDWADFIHQGIAAEQLLATGDAMAEAVVAVARNRVSSDTTNGDEHGRQQ
jgi:hypothetical protein